MCVPQASTYADIEQPFFLEAIVFIFPLTLFCDFMEP